ncbi:MAG TPA: endonuclease Q family protein [Candidatus Saccharimonadales bacterium]|nr:endonuclease Q family protein [Candidatus Saccharimonadales bacterium]
MGNTAEQNLIVDLHVHSHYSRATSRECTLAGLYRWGKVKGINVIGTGDFTHPQWFKELREELVPDAASGLYRLRPEVAAEIDDRLPTPIADQPLCFVPTVEISTIYSKHGRVRKLHQLVIMPSLETAAELNGRLERIGNLASDGRPILGLDSKELLRHTLEVSPEALYVPAHIWTPWFGLFGSRSGFDTLEEAYEELAPKVRAIETGLSSDPPMNWRLSQLEGLAVISNSDAHSPQKLGREATLLHTQLRYDDIIGGIKTNDKRLDGTIEFFPEEGKYHYDGHRECGVRLSPEETHQLNGICPKCGKPLTVGVDYRVLELADQPVGYQPTAPKRVEYIIPLVEILGELAGRGPATKGVQEHYWQLIGQLGSEFAILRELPLAQIQSVDPLLATAIERLRAGQVVREPGYDGIFGTIKVFESAADRASAQAQLPL